MTKKLLVPQSEDEREREKQRITRQGDFWSVK